MAHTKWKQGFFSDVEPISMRDPLAEALGAVNPGELIHYHYTDCVKVAGHACASVSSAFMMTKLALNALFGDETPVRGEISARIAGGREDGATGPIGQVIQFITGAAVETGFKGLGGRFARAHKFLYDENLKDEAGQGILAEFTRLDTGVKVRVRANPSIIPLTGEEMAGAQHFAKVVSGKANEEEREAFFAYWQGRNRKILLEQIPGLFSVERIG
ncbi:MAG: hypothetical protein HY751_13875 [Nitrospinae bacterium]|nr:hypothetical protein [Nitrospinota bacterium]